MNTNIKVAGTSFRPIPTNIGVKIDGDPFTNETGCPCANAQAVLVPEPTNEYDPEAVAVYVSLNDNQAFHLGYVPAKEPMKVRIKKPTLARMLIKDFSQVGQLNPSFIITSIEM